MLVYRLQKDDLTDSQKGYFNRLQQDFFVHDEAEVIDIFLDVYGFKTGQYTVIPNAATGLEPNEDTFYSLTLEDFLARLEDDGIYLDNAGKNTLAHMVLEKFSLHDWQDIISTFVDIYSK